MVRSRPSPSQAARANTAWLIFLATLLLFAGLVALLFWTPSTGTQWKATPLVVYCAAGLKAPVETVAKEYEATYRTPIHLNYGGSQTLLASLEVSRIGDLYLPADDSYVRLAREKGLAVETLPIATMNAVIGVKKGNPKEIRTLQDLLRPDVVLAQANPDAAAIGRITRQALEKSGHWPALAAKTKVVHGTVNEVANDVQIGSADAGFVWDTVVAQDPDLQGIDLPEFASAQAHVRIAVLRSCTQPTAALRFARYLAARDKGLQVFAHHGYRTANGDRWAETPELQLFSGAMLRPALEKTLAEFEQREGIRITRVYNGCGILVSQIKAGDRPDAYFSCDQSFMSQVQDLFLDATDISRNQLVILVPKASPHNVRQVQDLLRPGLRLGLAREQQSTLGALTQRLLRQEGLYDAVRKNVVAESATGDFLVNQLRTGSLDAVIVYRSNAAASADQLEAFPIELPQARAIQPVAVGRESNHKQLAARLIETIKSSHSKDRFLSVGFKWEAEPSPPADKP